MANVVLIATNEYLSVIKARSDFESALAFADSEALRALDVITRFRPEVVALDRLFAATSRGSALINRIKADSALNLCEIRIVPNDNKPDVVPTGDAPSDAHVDPKGTRRAKRVEVMDVDILVDGTPAALVDLSLTGAQVITPLILRPNQRIRVVLPHDEQPIRLAAWVAWASFEQSGSGAPRYRAGVEFFDADPEALAAFSTAHRNQSEGNEEARV